VPHSQTNPFETLPHHLKLCQAHQDKSFLSRAAINDFEASNMGQKCDLTIKHTKNLGI
jgi:hypothetical protein